MVEDQINQVLGVRQNFIAQSSAGIAYHLTLEP